MKVLGAGKDPGSVKAGDLAQGEAVTIGADDSAEEILRTMGATRSAGCPSPTDTRDVAEFEDVASESGHAPTGAVPPGDTRRDVRPAAWSSPYVRFIRLLKYALAYGT